MKLYLQYIYLNIFIKYIFNRPEKSRREKKITRLFKITKSLQTELQEMICALNVLNNDRYFLLATVRITKLFKISVMRIEIQIFHSRRDIIPVTS